MLLETNSKWCCYKKEAKVVLERGVTKKIRKMVLQIRGDSDALTEKMRQLCRYKEEQIVMMLQKEEKVMPERGVTKKIRKKV